MKPIIGIVPLIDAGRDSYWMLPGYMTGIEYAGGLPLMLPLSVNADDISQMISTCDGVLIAGGQDVSPQIYGEKALKECGEVSEMLDKMEEILLKKALDDDKPVLGICRGIQFMNALLGGTLYQDIPSQYKTELEHHQSPPYDIPVHEVVIEKASPLYNLLGRERLSVNSYHHQAVRDLSPKLKAMARAADGLVEAVYMPDKRFVWAVQWHPELSYKTDPDSQKIFEAFVSSAAKK